MKLDSLAQLDAAIRGRLVVSCQPVDNGPLDSRDVVARLAKAAMLGGAAAVRIEGVSKVALVREEISLPIIGIVKRDLQDTQVRITPYLQDVADLITAGANIVAVDGTQRPRPESIANLLAEIRRGGAFSMADCSCFEDALAAKEMGFDIVGTTLSGYTGTQTPDGPDFALIARLREHIPRLMAEGRFNTPQQAQEAMRLGAWAVTVGTAITRTELVTNWFVSAIEQANEAPSA